MGQKVNPTGFRVGITQEHSSIWFSKPSDYVKIVKEDSFIRDLISNRLGSSNILSVKIRRSLTNLYIDISSANPENILGSNNLGLNDLTTLISTKILNLFNVQRNIIINLIAVKNPDVYSKLIAEFMSEQLEKRVPFRRVIRLAMQKAQQAGVKGIKIQISGRLNGAEIARSEWVREGQVPLHTLRANINFCSLRAHTIYGILGIKVWIYSPF
uniref:Small ribosomal subunit protein uS3c n=1 Tax=Eutreptia sp. CCAC 1914B TaxID=2979827 RepID=A0A977K877_9EUGL|nr:ribosomal protein S3 [Eutreptia sp. CCAC 1914B]